MPIVNPLGSAPIFLSMTADLPTAARRMLPRRVAWNSFLLLSAAMLAGSHVLHFVGISVPIVRVGGGLLVIANGWRLLNAADVPPAENTRAGGGAGARSRAPRVLSADVSADRQVRFTVDCDHHRRGDLDAADRWCARCAQRSDWRRDRAVPPRCEAHRDSVRWPHEWHPRAHRP